MAVAPDTTLESAPNQPNFVASEHEILALWKKERTFEQLRKKLRGKPIFKFLDGPITANNPMGVHHAWGRTLKDIFIRYKCLNGFDNHFQNGFDCQGLWVEVEVEKELGFKGKPDIEAYGLDKFSQACKARILKFSAVQTEQSERLGQWMDWEHSYYTHTDKNILGIWQFLKRCHESGWLYRGYLPMPWCTRCGTSLSEHEMAGSYKDLKHLAVYIKLNVPALEGQILVWTTTPWTLPANTALAVNPSLEYSVAEVEGQEKPLILSSEVLKNWMHSNWKEKKVQIKKTLPGTALEGVEYEPIFADLPVQKGFSHKIVLWKDVDPKEGTGVVHIAPGCGREDFELSKEVTLERLIPVDEKGDYVKGYGFLEGKNAKEVAEEVAQYLQKNGKLLKKYQHQHNYPVCWRCKDELIFRLVGEWYLSSQEIRPKMLAAAATVKWQPEHVGKRMENWLTNMGDWCISRKRFWGLPLPFYDCSKCGTLTVVGSKEELQNLSPQDLSTVSELHRPWIDDITIKCPKCANQVSRVPEVGDCWLDAGIVPYSTLACYDKDANGQLLPSRTSADWICEMSEQVRLWFYSMLFMGVTLDQKAPYKHVLTYERVLAEDGTKFSKTGYMIKFDEAAERMGVDTMRFYFASQAPTNDLRFGYAQGDETRRQLISYWNILSFFMTYAEIDKPVLEGVNPSSLELLPIDRWLLASLYEFLTAARKGYEEFNTPLVIREFERFIDGVSNWYIRSNRRRFWKSESSKDKLAGYWTLFQAIKLSSLAMSPIIPFLTERIWRNCVRVFAPNECSSVHLAEWPSVNSAWKADELIRKVEQVRLVINMAHRMRSESQLKIRQPLSTLFVVADETAWSSIKEMEAVILGETNIKKIERLSAKEDLVDEYLELDLKKAGPVLKGELSKVVQLVNNLSGEPLKNALKSLADTGAAELPGFPQQLPKEIFAIKTRARNNTVSCEEQGVVVGIDTTVSSELEEEGWIRDLLRQSQVLRKDSRLEVTDRIILSVTTESARLKKAIDRYRTLIEQETLGSLVEGTVESAQGTVSVNLSSASGESMNAVISLAKRA